MNCAGFTLVGYERILGVSVYTLTTNSRHQLVFYAYLHSGQVLQDKVWFNAAEKKGDKKRFRLKWAQNTGGNLFMGSPLLSQGVITSVFDGGDAENAYIVCLDEQTGVIKWKYPTKNSIKNQMVVVDGKVVGTDIQGYTYAVDVEKGSLVWEADLKYHKLAGFVSGVKT